MTGLISPEELSEKFKKLSTQEFMDEIFTQSFIRELGNHLKQVSLQTFVDQLDRMSWISDGTLARVSQQYLSALRSFNIDMELKQLESQGVRRETLTIAMLAIRFSPLVDGLFSQFGDKRTRRRRAKVLLGPIPILQEMAKLFGDMPENLSSEIPNPRKVASDLRFLSSIFSWGEGLYGLFESRSLIEVSKFALASLVHAKADKFLDRQVSTLTAAALNDDKYDETNHRVWRITNYERLQKSVPFATRFLVAVNTVVERSKASL